MSPPPPTHSQPQHGGGAVVWAPTTGSVAPYHPVTPHMVAPGEGMGDSMQQQGYGEYKLV